MPAMMSDAPDRGQTGYRPASPGAGFVLVAKLGLEQVHGLEEGLLFVGGELVEDAGDRAGGAVEPFTDQGGLGRNDRDDRAPPVGRVGLPLDEARAVQVGEDAADGGQGQAQPGGQLADGDRAAAKLLERGDVPGAERRGHRGRGAVLPAPHTAGDAGKQLHQAQAQRGVL